MHFDIGDYSTKKFGSILYRSGKRFPLALLGRPERGKCCVLQKAAPVIMGECPPAASR